MPDDFLYIFDAATFLKPTVGFSKTKLAVIKGYGWLPYEYVLQGLAVDFWSLMSMEWVDTKQFGL